MADTSKDQSTNQTQAERDVEIEKLRSELSEARSQLEAITTESSLFKQQMERDRVDQETHIERLEKQIDELNSQHEMQLKSLNSDDNKLNQDNEVIDDNKENVTSMTTLKNDLALKDACIVKLRSEMEESGKQYELEISKLGHELSILQDQVKEAATDGDDKINGVKKCHVDTDMQYESRIRSLTEKLEQVNQEKYDNENNIADLNLTIDDLNARIDELKEEKQKMESAYEINNKLLMDDMSEMCDQLRKSYEDLELDYEKLKVELAEAKSKHEARNQFYKQR